MLWYMSVVLRAIDLHGNEVDARITRSGGHGGREHQKYAEGGAERKRAVGGKQLRKLNKVLNCVTAA